MSERAMSIEVARAEFERAMQKIGASIKKSLPQNFRSWGLFVAGRFRGHARTVLQVHTGKLSQSFTFKMTKDADDYEGRFGSRSKYAKIHEFGGTIRPKKARALAIPLKGSPAVIPTSGAPRYGSPLKNTLPKSYSFWVHKSPSGRVFLMGAKKDPTTRQTRGAKTRAQPWFLLLHSVTIPKRLGFVTYIQAAIKQLRDQLAKGAQEAIDG